MIVYILWKLCTLNLHNYVHYLKIVYVKSMYKILYIIWKIMEIKYIEFSTLFEKCVCWM